MTWFKVCASSEIEVHKPRKFSIDGQNILLAKSTDGRIWAFDSMCTHAEKSLERGHWNPDSMEITCPFHKAIFSIANHGAVKAPPACVPLSVYSSEIKIEANASFVYVLME